jgi:hypothetical protein
VKSFTGTLRARILEAEIRKSAKGKEYLSLKAEQLDEEAAKRTGPVWITSFHKSHRVVRPGLAIIAKGEVSVQRYEKNGTPQIALWMTADDMSADLEVLALPASKQADARAFTGGIPSNSPLGSATDVFGPRNKPKRTSAELAALAGPGDKSEYGKGFNEKTGDPLPF